MPEVSTMKASDDEAIKQFQECDLHKERRKLAEPTPGQSHPAAGVVPPSRSAVRRPGAVHLCTGLHERSDVGGHSVVDLSG